MGALVELKNITRSFGGVRALKGIDFDLQPGEVHALLGENGAGKSTLMKVLMGVHRPDAGTVMLAGRDLSRASVEDRMDGGIAMIFQELSLLPNMTVDRAGGSTGGRSAATRRPSSTATASRCGPGSSCATSASRSGRWWRS